MPRIAVILPVYNRAKVLPGAIESVLAQDFADFELIVVDDGSGDGSAMVARGYRDPRVRVVEHGANRGSNAARNSGIRFAEAPLLAFLDSDDRYLPHKLSTVVREFDARREVDVLVDSFVKHNCPGSKRPVAERRNPSLGCTEEFTRLLFCRELWKPTSAITVKREAAIRAGLFDEGVRRRQDLDFLIRLTEVANCAATEAILWVKGWSADGISAGDQFVASTLDIVRRHPQYLEKPEYRAGLAKDLARHLWQMLGRRCYAQVSSDTRLMVRDLGAARTGALMVEGTRELARRARQRRLKRRPGSPAEPLAPALAKARRNG